MSYKFKEVINTGKLTKENSSFIVRNAIQTAYCMNYDTFCKVMHNGISDYYSKEKFSKMRDNFSLYFCDLDFGNADRFMEYVLNRGE